MSTTVHVDVTVNGERREADVEARLLLVHWLRDELGLTGTHVGCDTTNCGACGPFPVRQLAVILGRVGGSHGRGARVKDVLDDVQAWVGRGDRVAIATVVGVKRSAPRAPGAKMAVNDRGEVSGAVSGGCVEGAVVEAAGEVLRGDAPKLLHFGIADSEAWDVGLPCGGEIDVFVEEFTA